MTAAMTMSRCNLRNARLAVVLASALLLIAGDADADGPVLTEEAFETAFNQAADAARTWAVRNGVNVVYVELCKSENWQYLREQFKPTSYFPKGYPTAEAFLLSRRAAEFETWMRDGLEQCAFDLQDRAEARARSTKIDFDGRRQKL